MIAPGRDTSRGIWIALFGPDGVGKSAAIEQLKALVGPAFSGILQFHFRPMWGTRNSHRPPVTEPHGRSPRGQLISLAKLIYWFLDCWCGYLTEVRPALRQSRLVIFDRYFPDILVDPQRYRLPQSSLPLARWLAGRTPQTNLSILLDAPAEVVQRRKAEVSASESQRQRLAYLAMFRSIPGGLIVNADCPVNEVAHQVRDCIFALLATSPSEPHNAFLIADH